MADKQDTITAIATAPGRGGIGIIRVSGSKSTDIVKCLTGQIPGARKAVFCAFRDQGGAIIDRGIVLYFQRPASFTGEDVIELHAHGGQVVLNMLLKRTKELGARQARPGEFTERAFLNDKLDLIQAEAVADLIDSVSEKAARSAMRSLEGEFSLQIQHITEQLIDIRAVVEGALDFPEEEIDFLADSDVINKIEKCLAAVVEILARAQQGRLLNTGVRVVIIGRPNVGKSSLLNRLLQTERAIVAATPGTTRDVIEDSILLDGLLVNIADTAGLRCSDNPVEQEGVRRAQQEIQRADIIVLVTDSGKAQQDEAAVLKQHVPSGKKTLIVHNKIDLQGKSPCVSAGDQDPPTIDLSAKTGAGINLLKEALINLAGLEDMGEDVVLARTRQIDALDQTRLCIANGLTAYVDIGAAEILAEELRNAQQLLGGITGEFTADDLLGEIFSRFCIGK